MHCKKFFVVIKSEMKITDISHGFKSVLVNGWKVLVARHEKRGGQIFRPVLKPGKYELERIPNPFSRFAGDWLIIRGTTFGLAISGWKVWCDESLGDVAVELLDESGSIVEFFIEERLNRRGECFEVWDVRGN